MLLYLVPSLIEIVKLRTNRTHLALYFLIQSDSLRRIERTRINRNEVETRMNNCPKRENVYFNNEPR